MQQPSNHRSTQQLLGEGMRAWRLLRDPRTPTLLKLIPAFGLLYVLFPVDLVPDLIPGAGQIDDIAILLIALRVFLQLAGPERRAGSAADDFPAGKGRATWFGSGMDQQTSAARPGTSAEPDVVTATYRVREE